MSGRERIQIRISDDELEAWVSIAEGVALTLDDLRLSLEESEVREGLDDASLATLENALEFPGPRPNEICVARGQASIPATPKTIAFEIEGGLLPGELREDGSMDFRERRMIVAVCEGDPVAHIVPPVEGKPGITVGGEPLEPDSAAEVELRLGDGVRLTEDQTLVATRDGARSIDPNGTIDVVDLHSHPGSVDPTSGNLETRGSLEIARNVETGMSVAVSGDVSIGGIVDGGSVQAGGAVEIKGGAIGRDFGIVRAGTDLQVGHALGIELYAKGTLRVARSISTSKLHALVVEVDGKALSDSISAENRIKVQSAGSPAGGPCALRVAIPLEPENFDPSLRPAMRRNTGQRRDKRGPNGSDARKKRGRRGGQTTGTDPTRSKNTAVAIIDLEARLDWRTRQRELRKQAVIEIEGTAFAGCLLDFGGIRQILQEDVRGRVYRFDTETDEIVVVET